MISEEKKKKQEKKKKERRSWRSRMCEVRKRQRERGGEGGEMEMMDIVGKAEKLVEAAMKGNDAAHVFRVRDMAVSLALEEGLSFCSDSMEIVELAALLHDIGDYKYVRLVFLLLNNLKFLSLL